MGHVRLGTIPRTRKWIQVLDLIDSQAATEQVAAATMDASQRGLARAAQDPTLVHTVWLLTQVTVAARKDDFVGALRELGFQISDSPSLLEVVGAFTGTVDAYTRQTGRRTDLGEMAEMAAAESLTTLAMPETVSLFGTSTVDVQRALRAFSTQKRFGVLAREFFSRLTTKYLNYFLSRVLSDFVEGNGRFTNLDEHSEFNRALELHCREAAGIVEQFSGGWFSKTHFKGGITPEKTAGFVHVALKKLRSELSKSNADG